jgi:pyrrolidone-carboxylate peptidase
MEFYITGFKPFKGRPKNGSETLVNSLRECPGLEHVDFRVLDVAWESFDAFFREIEGMDLAGIIGFGEGKEPSIVIERVGHNMSTGTDEFGVSKEDVAINSEWAPTNASRIRMPQGGHMGVEESSDAGRFLCNYELFHINSLDLATSAFIHLPLQQEMPDDEYVALLQPTILEILNHNFMASGNA